MVYSLVFLGFMSFIVWAHHMFMTGMGTDDGGVLPDDHDDHLDPVGRDPHGPDHLAVGRIDPLQHADALRRRLPADVRHRRADGLPLGFNIADIPLHDTYYVIGHFHYVVAPGRSSRSSRGSTTGIRRRPGGR
jgi:cytochrome c oxidase subunit 1